MNKLCVGKTSYAYRTRMKGCLNVKIIIFITSVSFLYMWRYRIVDMFFSIRFLRRFAIKIAMQIPVVKKSFLSTT